MFAISNGCETNEFGQYFIHLFEIKVYMAELSNWFRWIASLSIITRAWSIIYEIPNNCAYWVVAQISITEREVEQLHIENRFCFFPQIQPNIKTYKLNRNWVRRHNHPDMMVFFVFFFLWTDYDIRSVLLKANTRATAPDIIRADGICANGYPT